MRCPTCFSSLYSVCTHKDTQTSFQSACGSVCIYKLSFCRNPDVTLGSQAYFTDKKKKGKMVNKGQRRAHVRSTMQQHGPLHHPINYSLSTTPSAAVDMIHMLRKISRAAESLGIEQRREKTTTLPSCWSLAVKVSAETLAHTKDICEIMGPVAERKSFMNITRRKWAAERCAPPPPEMAS